MLLDSRIFGRGQGSKRTKSKRSLRHLKSRSSKSAHSKIPISSSNGPTRQRIPNSTSSPLPPGNRSISPIKEYEETECIKENDTKKPFKIKLNVEDNRELFGDGNGDKLPLPGMETNAQLIEMLLRDEYYSNVICDGQLPAKQIFIGFLYLLLIIAVDTYIEMTLVSTDVKVPQQILKVSCQHLE